MNLGDNNNEVDLSTMPHEEWLSFVFDHPVSDRRGSGEAWYWDYGFEISHPSQPSRLVEHVTWLCNHFPEVAREYSLPQVDQGIWFLLGPCIGFGEYLREPQISREVRRSCVHSMYRVYADFVSVSDVEEMETCFEMWWDLLLDSFYGYSEDALDEDAEEIENAMLDTLTRTLELDDPRTQAYALHGLGHMRHPKAREAVAHYIEVHGEEWTEEGRQWLQRCADGTVM